MHSPSMLRAVGSKHKRAQCTYCEYDMRTWNFRGSKLPSRFKAASISCFETDELMCPARPRVKIIGRQPGGLIHALPDFAVDNHVLHQRICVAAWRAYGTFCYL